MMEDYEVLEQIGRGATGSAFLILHKTEKKKYVLKKILMTKQTEKSQRQVRQELESISKMSSPYLLGLKESWVDEDECLYIVSDYCEGGDMADNIKKSRGVYFSEEKLCKWFTQLLLAVDYLHSNRILHRNLKCSNIFLTKENNIQLGDFGIGRASGSKEVTSSVVGTPNYICPELLEDTPYGYKSDIFSLGCCIFEMAAHHPPFRAADMKSLISKINRSSLSPLPVTYSSPLKQIIKTMLRKNPENRPTAAELLRHSLLQPYVRRCGHASAVFLPVKSSIATAKGGPKRPSPAKPAQASMELSDANTCPKDSSTDSEASVGNSEKVTKGEDPTGRASERVAAADMALISRTLSAISGGEVKLQRAEALESVLELCARLLKQEKIEELGKVLRPFGEEIAASRETAIWLTKTLIAHHNAKGSA